MHSRCIILIDFCIFVLVWYLIPKRRIKTYSKKLTIEQENRVREIVEQTLQKYPYSKVGDDYPEIRYKVLSEMYSYGEISKEKLQTEIDKLI